MALLRILLILSATIFVYATTLFDGIHEVVNTHPKILSKKLELENKKSQRASAWAKFLPKIDASAKYNQIIDETTVDNTTVATYEDYPKGIQIDREIIANWNIFNGFSDSLEVSSRSQQIKSLNQEYLNTVSKVVLDYVKAYIEVAKAKELYILANKKFDDYKNLYQKEIAKNNSGLSSLSFVSNIKGKFRSTQIELYEKQRVYQDKIAALSQYCKTNKNDEYYYPNLILEIPKNIEQAIKIMLENNHLIKKINYEINISKSKYQTQYRNALPTISLLAKKTWSNNYYEPDNITHQKTYLGVEAKINLFNGFDNLNSYIADLESYESKIQEKSNIQIEAIYKLKLKYNQYKLEVSKKDILGYFIKARHDALIGAGYDFDFGKIDISIYLNSISEFYGAREKYINNRYDTLIVKYELFSLLSMHNNYDNLEKYIINEEIRLDDERFFKKEDKGNETKLDKNIIYVVVANKTKIHKKPSFNSKVIKLINKNDEITSLEIKNKWIRVKDGWVYKDKVTNKYLKNKRYIVLKNINVREESFYESKVIGWYSKNEILFSVDHKNNWIKTNKGWVNGKNIKLKINPNEYYIVNTNSLLIRKKPNLKSKIIGRYMDMDEIFALIEKDGWVKTPKGWVSKQYLIKIKEDN